MSPQMPPALPAPKKTPVWVWILGGLGGLFALLVLAVVGIGWFAVNKVAEIAQNPRELASILTKANPDLELVDVDEDKKTIRVRDKKEGTVVTVTLSDLMQGKLRVSKEGKDGVESVQIGGKLDLPNWVPKFPGVEPRSLGSAQSDKDGEGGIFTFTTTVSTEKIRAFYREAFEKRGLAIKVEAGNDALVMSSEDGLNATVSVNESGGEQQVTVVYGEKKKP